jgi:hypothetical protein
MVVHVRAQFLFLIREQNRVLPVLHGYQLDSVDDHRAIQLCPQMTDIRPEVLSPDSLKSTGTHPGAIARNLNP